MGEINILMTFAVGLLVALLLGYVAHKFKCSPIIGYLLAGIVVSPLTPGFVADKAVADQFAEIGVILLMFGIGLRFNLRELLAVWRVAIPGALIQSTISTATLALFLHLFGWTWAAGIILGISVSVASTVVMALVLKSHHDLHAPIGYIAIGWTVVEDIISVAILLLLPILFVPDMWANSSLLPMLSVAALKIISLVVAVMILAKWVIPWILERIEKTHSRELFTLTVIVLAVGISVGSAKIFGVSMALGAFLAGLAVGRSDFSVRAASEVVTMRDAFAVLFFVSVGMLFDPKSLIDTYLLISVMLFVVVIIKPLAALLVVRVLGKPIETAAPVGIAFSQIGEFSFIVGIAARKLGILDDTGLNAMVATSVISIALNPFLYAWVRRRSSKKAKKNKVSVSRVRLAVDTNYCILVGYGPIGKTIHKILTDRGMTVMVVELNLKTIRNLRAEGHQALYGDIARAEVLEQAGIAKAASLILSTDIEDAVEIVKQVHQYNPDLNILVRCSHLMEVKALRQAGANIVAAGEAEVGVALAEAVTMDDKLECQLAAKHRDSLRKQLYNLEK